jgi:hypothetical protein
MEYDSLGLLFIGLSLMLLIAVLFGHQKREHMSNQKSKWNSIQKSVEDSLKEKYDFDIAKFRKNTSDQKAFFDRNKYQLEKNSELGFPLTMPEVKEMKDTSKPFDERYRLIHDRVEEIRKITKDFDSAAYNKSAYDLISTELEKTLKTTLTQIAKMYMLEKVGEVKPKSGLSTISKILG